MASRPQVVARVAGRIALQVVVVIVLGGPEISRADDLCRDWPRPLARLVHFVLHSLRSLSLLRVVHEDRGAVLRADVVALTIGGRRIVQTEEEPQDLFVAD